MVFFYQISETRLKRARQHGKRITGAFVYIYDCFGGCNVPTGIGELVHDAYDSSLTEDFYSAKVPADVSLNTNLHGNGGKLE